MRIVHVASSVSRLSGGVGPVVWDLARYQRRLGLDSIIVGMEDAYTKKDSLTYPDVPLFTSKVLPHSLFSYSYSLSKLLKEVGHNADLIHSHGLWLYSGYLARCFSKRQGIPLIISPHGMLKPWAMHHKRWKKFIYGCLIENGNLRQAAIFHTTSLQEAQEIKDLGWKNPVAVIPIGLDLSSYQSSCQSSNRFEFSQSGDKVLLFLSRIHPVKGLVHLAAAWNRIYREFPDWRLVIAGPDEDNHTQEIKRIFDPEAAYHVSFCGPVYGSEKVDLLHHADLFVLPTFTENFGIVVLESLACGVPVITTKGSPWAELNKRKCGWWIDLGTDPLVVALRKAMSLSDFDRRIMGRCGRQLVEDKYSWPDIAKKMLSIYDWAVGKGKRECITMGESL